MRTNISRDFYVPAGATKFADKASSAVVYAYTNTDGEPCAVAFHGKASKPAWRFRFRNEAQRAKRAAEHFQRIQAWEDRRASHRSSRTAFKHSFKVGDVFKTCWGYDQTNVEFFECTAVKGKMIEVREIAQEAVEDGSLAFSGRCVPMLGKYIGEPLRRRPSQYGVRIDNVRSASLYEPEIIAGAKVFQPASYSWGH